jgi:hypothetical protein
LVQVPWGIASPIRLSLQLKDPWMRNLVMESRQSHQIWSDIMSGLALPCRSTHRIP